MNEAAANIPWLLTHEVVARIIHHYGFTPEIAKRQIVSVGKRDRIKARGVIKGPPEGWGFQDSAGDPSLVPVSASVSLLLAAWNGTIDLDAATIKPPGASYEITNLQLCFIDLIAAGSLPAPAEKARWSIAEAIAYWVKGVPLPWKAWQGAGASDGEIEQAGIALGEAIGADQVRAWGRLSPGGPMEPLPGSDLRIPGFRWRVDPDGHLGTSPPGRLAVFEGRRWYGIEVDWATVRQTFSRPLTVRAAPAAAVRDQAVTAIETAPSPAADVGDRARAVAAAVESAAAPHPGGRPPVANWEMVEEEVFRLMNDNGEFSVDDPEWNAQARLEEAIADFCEKKFKKCPGETAIRDNIREPLERWRQSRSET